MFGDLFAAGSGLSSWRSEMDFEDIWAGPARKGRISAYEDGRGGSRQSTRTEQVGHGDDSIQGGAEKSLRMPSLHPISLNIVFSVL